MKTPTNIGGNNLVTFLQTATEFKMADLYTISLKSGGVVRYTTWDTDIKIGANIFLTGPPNIEHTAIEEKIGMDVSTIDVTLHASSTDLLFGAIPILQAIALGAFDGAGFKIERLFMNSAGQQIGTVIRFSGAIGLIDEIGRSYAKLQAESGTKLLQVDWPFNILQPGCVWTLFDAGCTLLKGSFAIALTVQAGSTVNKLITTAAQSDFYFDNGQILVSSGSNAGLIKAVRTYTAQTFYFNSPLPFAPSAGDTFFAYPGCDKTQPTCANKFSNAANFLGFRFVPVPETAL